MEERKASLWDKKLIISILMWLAFFIAINQGAIIEESYRLIRYYQGYGKALLYCSLFVLGSASIALLARSKAKWLMYLLSSVGCTLEWRYHQVSGTLYDVNDVYIIQSAREHISQYLIGSFWSITFTFFTILLIHWLIGMVNRGNYKRSVALFYGLFFLSISSIGMYAVVKKSNGNRDAFPAYIKPVLLYTYAHQYEMYSGPRDKIDKIEYEESYYQHILFIVDESIRGDFLTINDTNYATTPWLAKQNFTNFGVAYSSAICSDYSNILLMSGLQPGDLPDRNFNARKRPTLFQYAQQAGYHTLFVDAQSGDSGPDGFMTVDDMNYIDQHIQVTQLYPSIDYHQRDTRAIEIVLNNQRKHKKTFTYLIKYGCHFPYEQSYPNSAKYRRPIAAIEDWNWDEKSAVVNNYLNAVEWSVDHFFQQLIPHIDTSTTLILYTSDHGQNVMDDEKHTITHCLKSEAPSSMAKVPMLAFGWQSPKRSTLSSHFQCYGTLLNAMGYYGHDYPNLEQDMEEREYLSGDIFGRNELFRNEE